MVHFADFTCHSFQHNILKMSIRQPKTSNHGVRVQRWPNQVGFNFEVLTKILLLKVVKNSELHLTAPGKVLG